MARVYSYLRFSDPRQASGSSAARQLEYAQKWAASRGLVLDESLSLRDEGLSAYHQRHVTQGALGVFLRAVEDGHIESGSVLVVEGLDRLSRAEPLAAQAQLTQIIHAGITVVTASDGQEYSLESIKANPYRLIHSLVVMIRAHEESDTKSKRVRAAIRRQCEGWVAGTWRGIIRNGKDPHWVRWNGSAWEIVEDRAQALRYAIGRYLAGVGGVQIVREMAARGLSHTESGKLGAKHLYKSIKNRNLIGERELTLDGETYRLAGYYPALISENEYDALNLAASRRKGRRGVGIIPSILTGMGICTCGYCGRQMTSQNIMDRGRMPNGRVWPGHRRMFCTQYNSGGGCPVPGSIQAGVVERAIVLYCCDQVRLNSLQAGGDHGQAVRADMAASSQRLADVETRLDRLARALSMDDGVTPLTLVRQMRELESAAEKERAEIETLQRELANWRPAPSSDAAARWFELLEGIEAQDVEIRMQARELMRETFSRIIIWHAGNPPGDEDGHIIDMEITARGGGTLKLRIDRTSGGMISDH